MVKVAYGTSLCRGGVATLIVGCSVVLRGRSSRITAKADGSACIGVAARLCLRVDGRCSQTDDEQYGGEYHLARHRSRSSRDGGRKGRVVQVTESTC